MRQIIDLFLSLNEYNWGSNAYQWFFYGGVLLTLVFQKRKMMRIVFGWLPVSYLICIFNPLCLKLLNFAGLYNKAYFTRLFSFMPLMYVIAYGFFILLRVVTGFSNEWMKMIGVGIICGVICFSGHNIYSERWLTKTNNYAKVPDDTFEIAKTVDEKKGNGATRIAPIDDTTVYIRQIADVITPYGRYMGELGIQLSADPPDVQLVMETAGQQDMDYLVAHKSKVTQRSFEENGYEPFALTTNYVIYRVDSVKRTCRELNDKRQIISVYYLDADGEPEPSVRGYYSEGYTYDSNGRWVKKSFYDCEMNPYILDGCYSTIKRNYYLNNQVKSISYLDEYGKPVIYDGRCETRYEYDMSGKETSETYYDQSGCIMNNLYSMFARKEIKYFPNGDLKSEIYKDYKGNRTLSAWGYAEMRREYDAESNLQNELFYDIYGNEIGRVGENATDTIKDMRLFCQFTEGVHRNGDEIVLETKTSGNRFSLVLFQLFDIKTGEWIINFGESDHEGIVVGEYHHELPGGIYKLVFKGNTSISDEQISIDVYLSEGDMLYYEYNVDNFEEKKILVNSFSIGRNKEELLKE